MPVVDRKTEKCSANPSRFLVVLNIEMDFHIILQLLDRVFSDSIADNFQNLRFADVMVGHNPQFRIMEVDPPLLRT